MKPFSLRLGTIVDLISDSSGEANSRQEARRTPRAFHVLFAIPRPENAHARRVILALETEGRIAIDLSKMAAPD